MAPSLPPVLPGRRLPTERIEVFISSSTALHKPISRMQITPLREILPDYSGKDSSWNRYGQAAIWIFLQPGFFPGKDGFFINRFSRQPSSFTPGIAAGSN